MPETRPRILYVDDEEENLLVFRRSFSSHFDLFTASSGSEGLQLLENDEFAVVISDQRMPRMNGVAFLEQVTLRQPEAVTIIATAYTSFDDAMRAINEGRVRRFVRKPWKRAAMLEAIYDAAALFEQRRENRILTESLVREQETAAVGQLTSGLVHELANIAAVLNTIDDIREDLPSGIDLSEEVAALKKGVEKYWLLVSSLRFCAKSHELQLQLADHDLTKLLDEALDLARTFPQVRALARLEVHASEPCAARVDGPALQQVFLNLLKNAAEACSDREPAAVTVQIRRAEDAISIEIADTGPGVPEDLGERIFGGFYSTKGAAGTGLGLAVSRRIVEAHGGHLAFENHPTGCTFVVTLPLGSSGADGRAILLRPSSGAS